MDGYAYGLVAKGVANLLHGYDAARTPATGGASVFLDHDAAGSHFRYSREGQLGDR
jgi:hypothetical protein